MTRRYIEPAPLAKYPAQKTFLRAGYEGVPAPSHTGAHPSADPPESSGAPFAAEGAGGEAIGRMGN